jgi:TetR/AcrR family transcriptional regulator, repressor of fatR-cypB operon
MPRRNRRQDIIEAAEKLFTARRFHEVTTEDIAREAKVGKGTIYKYFADKDLLFFETANAGLAELCDDLENKLPMAAPFDSQLLKLCLAISRFFGRRRQVARAMQSEDGRAPFFEGKLGAEWRERRKRLIAAVAVVIKRGADEGAIRSDVAPEILAAFLLGMLRTRGRDLAEAPEAMRSCELVVDLFRNGARTLPASPAAPTGVPQDTLQ